MIIATTRSILIFGAALLAIAGRTAWAGEELAPAPAAVQTARADNAKPLDLRPPDITEIYTREQLDRMLAKFDKNIEEVEVRGTATPPPTFSPHVWSAIAAPLWALLHPTQAWRIIAPVPPDRARSIGAEPPDATIGYLEPAGVPR